MPPQRGHPNNLDTNRSDVEGSTYLSASPVHVRCRDGAACEEVTARYVAAAKARQAGVPDVAAQLAATGDLFAELHGLWGQLDDEVTA
jgi:hypothetical protein